MSLLFCDQDIEVVKLTLTPKAGGSTIDVYVSQSYYEAGELYTSSPEAWPLLAASPLSQRGVGVSMGIRFDVTLQLYGGSDANIVGESLSDYLVNYELHGAAVEIRYYSKPKYAKTTHVEATNVRQVLEVVSKESSNEGELLTINCADKWFDDGYVGRKIESADFATADDYAIGNYGAIVFGEDVIIDAHLVAIPATNSATLFGGWCSTGHNMGALNDVYVKNPYPQLHKDAYLAVTFTGFQNSVGSVVGEDVYPSTGYGATSLKDYHRGLPIDRSDHIILVGTYGYLGQNGTINAGDGKLSVRVVPIDNPSQWEEIGPALIEVPVDATSLSGGGTLTGIKFNPPVVLPGGNKYMVQWIWTSDTSTAYPEMAIKTVAGKVDYYRPITTAGRGAAWVGAADEELYASTYAMALGTPTHTTVNSKRYYNALISDASLLGSFSETWFGHSYKMDVDGIKDDSSGNITGSASALLQYAPDIILYLVFDEELGIDHGTGIATAGSFIDATEWAATRASLVTAGLKLSYKITSRTLVSSVIADLCFHSRTVFYKQRNGDLSIAYPANTKTTADDTLNEYDLRGDFVLLGLNDTPHENVVNDFVVGYAPNDLEVRADPDTQQQLGTLKYSGSYFINSSDSSDSDTTRETDCDESQDKYGVRPFRHDFPGFTTEARAKVPALYHLDRFSDVQEQCRVRVLRKDYLSRDVFDTIDINSFGLPVDGGSADPAKSHSSGTPTQTYESGIPVNDYTTGNHKGQVFETLEYGPFIEFLVETVAAHDE